MSESFEMQKQIRDLEAGMAEIAKAHDKITAEINADMAKRGILLTIPKVEKGEKRRRERA